LHLCQIVFGQISKKIINLEVARPVPADLTIRDPQLEIGFDDLADQPQGIRDLRAREAEHSNGRDLLDLGLVDHVVLHVLHHHF